MPPEESQQPHQESPIQPTPKSNTQFAQPSSFIPPRMTLEDAPNTPVSPPQQPPASFYPPQFNQPSGPKGPILIILIVLVIIAICAGVAYAYFEKIGPFSAAPYHNQTLASDIFKGIANIKSAEYTLAMTFQTLPKEADAVPFSAQLPATTQARVDAYRRDQDKIRTINTVLFELQSYQKIHKTFPKGLAGLPTTSNPSEFNSVSTYTLGTSSSEYLLTFTLETADAASALKNQRGVTVQDKTVTFTGTTSTYPFLSIPATLPQPAFVDIINLQKELAYLPADTKFDATITGGTSNNSDGTLNGILHASANASMGDLNMSLEGELRKVSNTFYVELVKFPSLFGASYSAIKNKWIKITAQDLPNYGVSYLGTNPDDAQKQYDKKKDELIQELKLILQIADQDQVLTTSKAPVRESVKGVSAYRYDLEFNKNNFAKFYKDVTQASEQKFGNDNILKFDQSELDYLQSPEFSQVFDYLHKNTSLTLWATSNGTPVQLTYSIRVVPDSSTTKQTQEAKISFTLSLDKINMPISIQAPASSMSVEDATLALTGQSKEEYEFEKQISAVQTVRSALETYKRLAGSYPDSLSDLTKTRDEVSKLNPKQFTVNGYVAVIPSTDPILKNVPVDVYTHEPFTYTKDQNGGYMLKYTIQLPPYKKGTMPSYEIYGQTYLQSSYSTRYFLNYLNGTNTANQTVVSVEAKSVSNIDTDKDGLSDSFEDYLGTDKNKKDTDGDGYSDGQEFQKGTDPNGPGNLTSAGFGAF